MECKVCNTEMIIDEWGGWVWVCYICGYVRGKATSREIEKYEEELWGGGV